jgi:hypothetical protein
MMTHKIKSLLWQLFFLAISTILFSLILENRAPNLLRPMSMALRTGFGLVIPLTALILYLAFRIPNRIGDFVSMAATLSLFAMQLAGLWASGQTQSVAISGLVPLTDAAAYHTDSLRIITGQNISYFSAMRPFFPGFLSFLMSITDQNFMASLAMITLIAAIAIYFGVREIQRRRVKLDKLHIRHLGTSKIRHRHPVARRNRRICRVQIKLPRTARAHDHSVGIYLAPSSKDRIEK